MKHVFGSQVRHAALVTTLGALTALLAGCASGPSGPQAVRPFEVSQQDPGAYAKGTRLGLDLLARGDLVSANRAFSAALSSDPRSVPLNHLNGLTYHLRYRSGDRTYAELAETGYRAALDQQGDFIPSALQLGHLYFETNRYTAAQRIAAYVLDLEPDNAEAARILAAASYYVGDFEMSVWAVERAKALGSDAKRIATLEPIIYAAAGMPRNGQRVIEKDLLPVEKSTQLGRRVQQWENLYGTLLAQAAQQPSDSGSPQPPEAPTLPPESNSSKSTDSSEAAPAKKDQPPALMPSLSNIDPPSLPKSASQQPSTPPGAALEFDSLVPTQGATTSGQGGGVAQGPIEPAWFDCQQSLNQGGGLGGGMSFGGGSFGSSTGDETTALPALPAPCRGRALPRMAVIDVVILRTDDVTTSGYGVNLLDSLSVFVSRTITQSRGINTSTDRSGSVADVLALGDGPGAGIAYSLNIANASDQSANVIARPSLLVLDRQSGMFFSGSIVSLGLISPQGGGTVQDKPVGISLSVTPTFIDDDSMLMSVRAARSFFEETAPSSSFEQSLQTSRNIVSANTRLKFNQTLILSGLSEREVNTISSGVPLLRDIPGVQYLFQRRETRDFTKSVIILVTPRRVSSFSDTMAQLDSTRSSVKDEDPQVLKQTRAKALAEFGGVWPNLLLSLRHMDRNKLFKGVRTGDLGLEDWHEPGRLQRMVNDVVRLAVH